LNPPRARCINLSIMDIRTPCQQKIRSINYITATKHSKIIENVSIPVIASSGAGKVEHFSEVFKETDVEAALAAGIFHREEVPIEAVKEHMRDVGIETR